MPLPSSDHQSLLIFSSSTFSEGRTQIYLEGFKKQNRTKGWVSMEEDGSVKSWVKGKNDQGKLHETLKEHTHTQGGRYFLVEPRKINENFDVFRWSKRINSSLS